ncbi:ATP-binding protein [Algoriphagus sp. CAU 1675]|uniref:ATP-binding protein n=1 Tax=Algoriphagus sp. CAU 1675 TaxID=3032597 RepID=UPI0023DA59AB|nr:ATP-binding protein [Algoriphagus sp. CAU 1675]MDF2156718.1 ATP-binding protein [Algoriphagus sp. CAU 1675]
MKSPKRVLILGPESTGKSTLASDLAAHFGEPWVPEFAREYLENLDRPYEYEDLSTMALGQIESEDSLAKQAREFLFCDTDLRVIHIWSEHKYGKTESWILEEIAKRSYSRILLTDIDLPWEEDPLREHPEPKMRSYFLEKYKQLAMESEIPFLLVSGGRSKRLEKALEFIQG